MAEWGKFFIESGKKLGRVITPVPDSLQEKGLEAAGFVEITSSPMKIPLTLESDVEDYISFMAGLLEGWTQEQVLMYCLQFRRELKAKKTHGYKYQRIVYARKPELATS
ncbi:hypothetical protein ACHAQH_001808 [Verticillium albo-atrum]